MARTRNQDSALGSPSTPTLRGRTKSAPRKIILRQARTEGDDEPGQVGVEVLKEWNDWDMPLFKLLQAATVKEEWLGMLLELFREIFWRFRHLGKEILTEIVQRAHPETPGVVWAPDFGNHAEKIMQDIQANVCQTHEVCARIFLRTPEGVEYRVKSAKSRKGKHKVATPGHAILEKVLQLKPHELMALWAPIITSAKLGYWDDHKSITNGRAVLAYMKWSSYSIISQFVGLMKSDQNAEIDISAEARQMVLLSTQDSGQLGYWPVKDEDYPIDPKAWIAKPTHIENGIEYKDFQNLMSRFKYTPGDPLEFINLDEIPPKGRGGRKPKRTSVPEVPKKPESPIVSDTVFEDTPPVNSVSAVVMEGLNQFGTNSMSKEFNATGNSEVAQVVAENREESDSDDIYSGAVKMVAKNEARSTTVVSVEGGNGDKCSEGLGKGDGKWVGEYSGKDVVYIADTPVVPHVDHKKLTQEDPKKALGEITETEMHGVVKEFKDSVKGKNAVREVVKVDEIGSAGTWLKVESKGEEMSEEESSGEEDDESGDDAESGDDSENSTESESEESSSGIDELNEDEEEARKRLKRYGGFPVVQATSSRLDVGRVSRLNEQEFRVVERVNEKAKKDELYLPVWIHGITFTEYMKQAAVRYALMGSVGRAAHDLAELKKMNQYYKEVIVEMVNLKTRNEKTMLEIEEERAKAVENERVYELALQEMRGSSMSVSSARTSRISSASLAVEAQGSSSTKPKRKRGLVVDREMPLFGTKTKKLKAGK